MYKKHVKGKSLNKPSYKLSNKQKKLKLRKRQKN